MLASGVVVEEYDLSVLLTLDLSPSGVVAWLVHFGVDADDLSVAFIPEKESLVAVGVRSEVGRVVNRCFLAVPVVVAEVSLLGHQHLLLLEDWLEIFLLHAVGQVDVTADLRSCSETLIALLLLFDFPYEQNSRHPAILESCLTLLQRLQEGVIGDLTAVTC